MSEWIIEVNDGEEVLGRDDGLYDVIVSDTFNPFGNFAKGFFDDLEGQLFDLFQRGTKVSFQYSNDNTSGFTQRFVGYVVNDLAQEADGAEQLEIEAHTFDQFLRGSEVSNDQTGNTVFEALEDVITTDVPPVSWDASLVEVVDNVELTQSFQGETVEEFLLGIRQKSAGEVFTVNEDLTFVFEPAEISRTRRDIDNSQWVTHDIGEEGSETRNQVTVVYNDGENAVTVDDSSDQLEIQDNLGAPGPGQEGTKISRPKLTNFEDAIDVGEQALQDRESTLTGPVTTFDLNSAEPGEVIGITIEPRGIDTDFRIAENRMQWRSETNELTVVAKKGADDDILIQQSKTLKRVENRVQDLDVVPDRVTDTKATALLDVSATDGTVTEDSSSFVNDGRNRLRDGIIEESTISSFRMEFSTSGTRVIRSDSSLSNVVDTQTPSVSTNGDSVTYTASTSSTGIQTVGVFDDTANDLLAIARLSDAVDSPSIDLTISVSNSPEETKTVWTDTGQTLIRDILAGNAPSLPEEYAFGSDTTDPVETDTSLGTPVISKSLDEFLLKSVDSTAEWLSNVDIPDGSALTVQNGTLTAQQSSFFLDANDNFNIEQSTLVTDSDAHDGDARSIASEGDFIELTFENAYDWEEMEIFVRLKAPTGEFPEVTVEFDFTDTTIVGQCSSASGYLWLDAGTTYENVSADTHTIRLEVTQECLDSNDDPRPAYIDVINPRDIQYNYTNDNTVDANNNLSGPEEYPDLIDVGLNTTNTQRDITELTVDQKWTDVSNQQYLEARIGSDSFTRSDNTETLTVTGGPAKTADVNLGLSRYATDTTTSPTSGDTPQAVDLHELLGNPDTITKDGIGEANVRTVVRGEEAINQTFAEAGLVDSADNLITSGVVPEFEKQSGQLVISSERLRFEND
jgi:hypothetical protein